MTTSALTSVHLVTLGCARNDVDSEELAARLEDGGFRLVDDPDAADAVMVNTCGFIEQAKADSIQTLLEASRLKEDGHARAVVAVGCMAERYGRELADELPEADAVLGFDDYGSIAERLQAILAGEKHRSHVPRDRRALLPLAPAERQGSGHSRLIPGHGGDRRAEPDLPSSVTPASGPRALRRRLGSGPSAPVKIASGCDRRCTFCAIPSFRGAYLSRPVDDIVAETRWLVDRGVKEAFLVSENTSSYGKDLGDIRALETLLARLSGVDGLEWIRASYLQPAETRPGYSDEDGTAAAGLDAHLDDDEIEARRSTIADLVTELVDQRAEDRIGETVTVLIEEPDEDDGWVGRAAHQGPEVDGTTRLGGEWQAGAMVEARIVASVGADLEAAPLAALAEDVFQDHVSKDEVSKDEGAR